MPRSPRPRPRPSPSPRPTPRPENLAALTRSAVSILTGLLLAPGGARGAKPPVRLELESVQRIWDAGEHNAFTDLERFGGRFYCVFREGKGHVSSDGKVRVLASADGSSWRSVALLESAGQDLRDPKITTMPDGRLMVTGGAAVRQGEQPATSHRSFVAFSRDGSTWRGPLLVGEKCPLPLREPSCARALVGSQSFPRGSLKLLVDRLRAILRASRVEPSRLVVPQDLEHLRLRIGVDPCLAKAPQNPW